MTSAPTVTCFVKQSQINDNIDTAAPLPSKLRGKPPYQLRSGNLYLDDEFIGERIMYPDDWYLVGHIFICPLYRGGQFPTEEEVTQWRTDNPDAPANWDADGVEVPHAVFARFAKVQYPTIQGEAEIGCGEDGKPVILLSTENITHALEGVASSVLRVGGVQYAGLDIFDWDIIEFEGCKERSTRGKFRYTLEDLLNMV